MSYKADNKYVKNNTSNKKGDDGLETWMIQVKIEDEKKLTLEETVPSLASNHGDSKRERRGLFFALSGPTQQREQSNLFNQEETEEEI
ncbi:unnamed protein product [Clonostachys chloroleuca]|uniref:Uncharacterized protein n=1 Tax=Clonostachys chloroleuca TaxID=1926264 RepID=A0AA35LYW1_9HYPO|nr:unnamed protein product [Clonostachys chloroleuca]